MITSSLYDLAAHPEYIPILREEVNEVFEKFDGEWNPESMSQLKKMDSFVKESQRLGGAAVSSFQRRAAKNITLSDGTFIPAGTLLMAPSLAVSADESIYPDADTFDGLRYFKLRQRSKEDENIHQFTTTSKNMLHFGVGRHACPGRWFASAEIKMVLAELILEYDFKLKEGEGKPKSLNRQYQNMPNPTAQLLFKRREL
jgi:cytochrome P450